MGILTTSHLVTFTGPKSVCFTCTWSFLPLLTPQHNRRLRPFPTQQLFCDLLLPRSLLRHRLLLPSFGAVRFRRGTVHFFFSRVLIGRFFASRARTESVASLSGLSALRPLPPIRSLGRSRELFTLATKWRGTDSTLIDGTTFELRENQVLRISNPG